MWLLKSCAVGQQNQRVLVWGSFAFILCDLCHQPINPKPAFESELIVKTETGKGPDRWKYTVCVILLLSVYTFMYMYT